MSSCRLLLPREELSQPKTPQRGSIEISEAPQELVSLHSLLPLVPASTHPQGASPAMGSLPCFCTFSVLFPLPGLPFPSFSTWLGNS